MNGIMKWMKWNRNRIETKHREGPRWLLQITPWCLSIWETRGENTCALCLLMREKVTYRPDLWTHQQRRTNSTKTLTSAHSGPVKAASFLQHHIVSQTAHFCIMLLPFTIGDLAKLLCRDSWSSPALSPIPFDFTPASLCSRCHHHPHLLLGYSAVMSPAWQKSPLHLLSYLQSYLLPFAAKRWVTTACRLPFLSSSSLLIHPLRLSHHNPSRTPPVKVSRGLHVAKYNGQFPGVFRLDESAAFDVADHSILTGVPHLLSRTSHCPVYSFHAPNWSVCLLLCWFLLFSRPLPVRVTQGLVFASVSYSHFCWSHWVLWLHFPHADGSHKHISRDVMQQWLFDVTIWMSNKDFKISIRKHELLILTTKPVPSQSSHPIR